MTTPNTEQVERSLFLRILISLLWFLPFTVIVQGFIGAVIGGFTTSAGTATTFDQGYDQGYNASFQFFQKYGRMIFVGEFIAWLGLCIIGFFPGTGKFKKIKPAPQSK